MHSSFLLSLMSAGALTLALPYSSTEPTTTTLDAFTNYPAPAAPTGGLHLPKSNLTSAANTTSVIPSSKLGSHYGWVGSYDNRDCSGGPRPNNRPKMDTDDCIKFKPDTNTIGINYGTWPDGFAGFYAFSDGNCKTRVTRKAISEAYYPHPGLAGTCLSVSENGGTWGSIRKWNGDDPIDG